MKLRKILKMSDAEILDLIVRISEFHVTDCEVDEAAFFAGATTWMNEFRAGSYPTDAEALAAIRRHLNRWNCGYQ